MTSPDEVLEELRRFVGQPWHRTYEDDEVTEEDVKSLFKHLDMLMKSGRVPIEWDHT